MLQKGDILYIKPVGRSVITLGLQDVVDRFQLYLEAKLSEKLVLLLQGEAFAVEDIVLELHKVSKSPSGGDILISNKHFNQLKDQFLQVSMVFLFSQKSSVIITNIIQSERHPAKHGNLVDIL